MKIMWLYFIELLIHPISLPCTVRQLSHLKLKPPHVHAEKEVVF